MVKSTVDVFEVLSEILENLVSKQPLSLSGYLEIYSDENEVGDIEPGRLVEAMVSPDCPPATTQRIRDWFSVWDGQPSTIGWASGTAPKGKDRRVVVFDRLGIEVGIRSAFMELFPIYEDILPDLWPAVSQHLLKTKLKTTAALKSVNDEADRIVTKIRTLRRTHDVALKGMVVGHVQSGKTVNMTAVVAKTLRKDFDLIVVVSGTKDLLRIQTQNRFDGDLIGRITVPENEYKEEIFQEFIEHSQKVFRATSTTSDFGDLGDQHSKLSHSKLKKTPGIMVIKKNPTQVRALIDALKQSNPNGIEGIRALILDDECDSATPNMGQHNDDDGDGERSATNKVIIELLAELPNSTYIGYTATPYANICIDTGSTDIYPDHFIHLLEAPTSYHGYVKFFDIDGNWGDDVEGDSKVDWEKINLRFSDDFEHLTAHNLDATQTMLAGSIDSWVLSGALKLWKMASDPSYADRFKYHSFLLHDSHLQKDHENSRDLIISLWAAMGLLDYQNSLSPATLSRLRASYRDFESNLQYLGDGYPFSVLPTFELLEEYIHVMLDCANSEVRVITGPKPSDYKDIRAVAFALNGDSVRTFEWDQAERQNSDNEFETMAADQKAERLKFEFCKIIVGGNLLSRGYTVEGITTVIFGRGSRQVDTLLQMGRWFGYRNDYRELMRIGFHSPDAKNAISGRDLAERFRVFGAVDRDVRQLLSEEESTWGQGPSTQVPAIERLVTRLIEDPNVGDWFRNRLTSKNNGYGQLHTWRKASSRYRFGAMSPSTAQKNWVVTKNFLDEVSFAEKKSVTTRPESIEGKQGVSWLAGVVAAERALKFLRDELDCGRDIANYGKIDLESSLKMNHDLKCVLLVRTLERKNSNRRVVQFGSNGVRCIVPTEDFATGEPLKFRGGGPIDRAIDGAMGTKNVLLKGENLDNLHEFGPFSEAPSQTSKLVVLAIALSADADVAEGDEIAPVVFPHLYLGRELVEKLDKNLKPADIPDFVRGPDGYLRARYFKLPVAP